MIIVKTGACVEARTASSDDLLQYQDTHNWKYHACDYLDCDRKFPSKWFFSNSKEDLLKAVFQLKEFKPVYRSGRWHVAGLNAKKYGAMVYTDWGEHSDTREQYGPDTDRELLIDAFWVYAQVMDSFMALAFFGPIEELIEGRCRSLVTYVHSKAWGR